MTSPYKHMLFMVTSQDLYQFSYEAVLIHMRDI